MTTIDRDNIAAELFADEETGMVWEPVKSSQISEVGYNDGAEYPLGIKFPAGTRTPASEYHYANVPRNDSEGGTSYEGLMDAESIGSYFTMNIKRHPELYPYIKVETDIPVRNSTFTPKEQVAAFTSDKPEVSVKAGEILPPSTALSVIDKMADELLFTPGAVTDAQLAAGREWYLIEAKKYDISTEKARAEFRRFARPLQKLRTGIEARAKELTGATKRKIAAIDAEKRRLVAIVGGIEDEVLAPLTSWEAEEEARISRLAAQVSKLAQMGTVYEYDGIQSLEGSIAYLESFDVSAMQEYKIGAESAIAASLKVLKPELERRKQIEAQAAELAKLRAEAAERAEKDRMEAAARVAKEQAQREAAEELQRAENKRLEAEQALKDAETRRVQAEEKAVRDREAAVEAERQRAAKAAAEAWAEREARAADSQHKERLDQEAANALMAHCQLDEDQAMDVVKCIAKGRIPHVTIEY